MYEVVEPPGVRRATQWMFVLFAGSGLVATVVLLASGEGVFGVLFGSMFIGIPWIIHRASKGPGVPGFTLGSDGIFGAADDEHTVIPWGQVAQLSWRATGLTINDDACLTLHADLTDGRSIRVSTYTARRGREVEDVEVQFRASGMLPAHVTFTDGPRSAARASPTKDAVPSDAGVPRMTGWSDLPAAARLGVGLIALFVLVPFVLVSVMIPILLVVSGGPIGWFATAITIAVMSRVVLVFLRARRTPVLTCSFTVEGVVADGGDGLTIPWRDGSTLRIESTVTMDQPAADGRAREGWVVRLDGGGATPANLSPVLTTRTRRIRAVRELASARAQGLVPAQVELALPQDLAAAERDRLLADWNGR